MVRWFEDFTWRTAANTNLKAIIVIGCAFDQSYGLSSETIKFCKSDWKFLHIQSKICFRLLSIHFVTFTVLFPSVPASFDASTKYEQNTAENLVKWRLRLATSSTSLTRIQSTKWWNYYLAAKTLFLAIGWVLWILYVFVFVILFKA